MTALFLSTLLAAGLVPPFTIQVVDQQNGRGVPLIELRTTHHLRYVTDSNGIVAFDEPGLMNVDVWFGVSGHGYEFPKDGFGFRGKKLTTLPGGSATLAVKRVNIAERLYRITGEGIYADSEKVGQKPPLPPPNARIVGCDSVMMTPYRGKLFWVWGDTTRAAYPLGNFHATAATSPLPGPNGVDPDRSIEFTYFADSKGFVKGIAPMPGKGPTWIESLVTLPGNDGRERLWASFVKVEGLKAYARGVAVFDDDRKQFERVADLPVDAPVFPRGHTFRHVDDGVEYLYFTHPFPLVRVPATETAFTDLSQYEAYTCLVAGSTVDTPVIDRDASGKAQYRWRKNARPIDSAVQAKLLGNGTLQTREVLLALRDRVTGTPVQMHNGSVNWNAYRKKWVMLANQVYGKPSFLGEVWYAEADQLTGPWRDAVKVATHDRMDFYNPKHHVEFDRDGGRVIYFEGTYTKTFSGNPDPTPRYEYNQVMYRLDLADERLHTHPTAK